MLQYPMMISLGKYMSRIFNWGEKKKWAPLEGAVSKPFDPCKIEWKKKSPRRSCSFL